MLWIKKFFRVGKGVEVIYQEEGKRLMGKVFFFCCCVEIKNDKGV